MSRHPSLKSGLRQFARISLKSIQLYNENYEWIVDQIVDSTYKKFVINNELKADEFKLFLFVCEEYCRVLRKQTKLLKSPEINGKIFLSPGNFDEIMELSHALEMSKFPRNQIGMLYFFDQVGPKKISELLSVNINTVKYHIKILKRYCFKQSSAN